MPNLLHRLKINEVSSCKVGAGRGVKVMLMKIGDEEPYWKRDFSQKQRDDAANTGAAMPDGSFPIHNESDLHNAIRLAGNAKDPAAAKKHIKARASSMGMNDAIPDTWGGTAKLYADVNDQLPMLFKVAIEHGASIADVAKAEVAMNKVTAEIEKIDEGEQTAALEKVLSQCVEHLAGIIPKEKADAFEAAVSAVTKEANMPTEAERIAKEKADADLKKTLDDMQKSNAALTRQVAILSMSKEHQEYLPVMPFAAEELPKAQELFIAATPEKRDETMKAFPPKKKPAANDDDDDDMGKMAKAIAESPVVKALQTENAEFKKAAKIAQFAKEAVELGLPEAHGEVMMKAYSGDPEAIKTHNKMVKELVGAARAQDATSTLFAEFGKTGGDGAGTTAYDQIKIKAEELRKSEPKLSVYQARAKVLEDPSNRDLVQRHKAEESRRRVA